MTEKQPRKHKDLIVEWANGAEIEWYDSTANKWEYIESPAFSEKTQYRIKKAYPVGRFAKFQNVWCTDAYFIAFVPKQEYNAKLSKFICWLTDEITLIADPHLP